MGSYARSLQGTMLANLTSLIWGSGNTAVTATTTTTTVTPSPDPSSTTTSTTTTTTKDAYEDAPEEFTSFNIRATTPTDEEEADWVLVDRAEVGEASCGGVDTIGSATATSSSALTTTVTSRAAISAPVPPVSLGGEWSEGGTQDCWLMTPPPCFTRSQPAPLASSSLENLLIEHPSMSVYLPRPTYTSAATTRVFPQHVVAHSTPSSCSPPSASPSSQPAVMERDESPMKENTENTVEEVENQVAEAPPARGGVAQRASSLLRAIDVLRPAQKAQRRREERRLKRTALERSNKVREVAAASNKRSKRCDMMAPGKFSRAVNNRKC
ncbi:endochitinase A-like isoform X1 [Portunus trituberculatus]|nr:endochitinase A-like isoform X1 [Portunus trituberculatus]